MVGSLGDFIAGDVIDFKFPTTVNGEPTVFTDSPAVSVYKSNSTTQSTSGVSLTVDFDSLVGLNHVHITTVSDGTFYAAAGDYDVVITAGTTGGISLVGTVVGHFSIANRSTSAIKTKTDYLPSATAGAAGGVFIAGTNAAIAITTALTADITGALSGAVGSVTGAVGSVTAGVTLAAGAVSAAALAADAVDEILDETIGDGTLTMRQALRVIIAGMAGKLSGAATTTVTIRNAADSANVIVATVDAVGNRSAVTVTP